MASFTPENVRFILRGVNLNRPVDLLDPGDYPVATNIRSYVSGIIQTRPGWSSLATTGASNVHSIKRLNDPIATSFALIVGAGTSLYIGSSGALLLADSGYSGNGLAYVIVPPVRTPRAWCYIGDSQRLRKAKADGTNYLWGIVPPTTPPLVQFGAPKATIIENFESTAGWTAAGAGTGITGNARINTTITAIVFDAGTTGWATVQPASTVNMGRGAVVTVGAESNIIIDTFAPGTSATTIAAIAYDSGSTGLCSIQLTAPTALGWIKKFSLLIIGGEPVTVIDVVVGPDNIPSIRCSTSGTHSAGEAVVGQRSFRAYFTAAHSAGEAITSNAVEFETTGAGDGSQVTGIITKAITVDASLAGGRPIDPENDEVHISIWVGKLNHWINATLFLDVDATVNDGTQNAYFKTLTVNDFAGTDPTDTTTTVNLARLARLQQKLKNAIQAGDFDRVRSLEERIKTLKAMRDQVLAIPLDDQSAIGNQQWHELRFKTKEFFRIGTDYSRTLKDVAAIILVVNANKTRFLRFDSCWIGGTYGPDVGNLGDPYRYTYRYRSSETGVTSAWSPPSRSGIEAHKQRVMLTPAVSADSQVDKIDYARIGGVLDEFKIIGTGSNSGSFDDDLLDDAILGAYTPDFDSFQPFATTDLPRTGTCNVAGTTVTRVSGDTFNTAWARNTIIIINKVAYTLYGPPISSSVLQLNENAGAQSGVAFYMEAPLLTGQPLPAVWGPLGYGQSGIFTFGCGDAKNAGSLYWTNGNDPDLMHDGNVLEICSPSELLVNGCIWAGRSWVFSSDRYYEVFPNFSLFQGTIQGQSTWVSQPVAGSIGLFNRYCLAVGKDGIYFLGKDGIYHTTGGAPVSITDETLFNLFPHEGRAGVATNGYQPVDMTQPMRLCYYDEFIYFSYVDTSGNHMILVFNTITRGWIFDLPRTSQIRGTVVYGQEGDGVHSLLLGGSTAGGVGTIWQSTGDQDDGLGILAALDTPAMDNGDVRLNKEFGDFIIDAFGNGTDPLIVPGFDNYETLLSGQSLSRSTRSISPPFDLNSGAHQLARNMGLRITWDLKPATQVLLYAWQYSYVVKPVNTVRRFTDWSDLGVKQPKFIHGIRLHADTLGVSRSIRVQGDNGTNGIATTNIALGNIIHDGESINDYDFNPPFIAHLVRLAPNDANQWRLFDDYEFQYDLDVGLVFSYISQVTANDLGGFQHIRDMYIAHISTADLSFVWVVDGVSLPALTIPHGSGVFTKSYVVPPAVKWKTIQYKLTSTAGFRLYKRDCEVRCKAWGSMGPYQTLKPFGDLSFNEGPRL